jgi:hypothetical protein
MEYIMTCNEPSFNSQFLGGVSDASLGAYDYLKSLGYKSIGYGGVGVAAGVGQAYASGADGLTIGRTAASAYAGVVTGVLVSGAGSGWHLITKVGG